MDLAARIGGEEFAVFLIDADWTEAMTVAERIRETIRTRWSASDAEDKAVTVSIGVCVRRPGQVLDDILLKADRNLYAAKGRGRDRVVGEAPLKPVSPLEPSSNLDAAPRASPRTRETINLR